MITATVTANKLNVRAGPSLYSPVVGRLQNNDLVAIHHIPPGSAWYRIGTDRFIHSAYVRLSDSSEVKLRRIDRIRENPVVRDACRKKGLLLPAAWAVLCVESAGEAFGPSGRIMIRFEAHKFKKYLPRSLGSVFADYFCFDSDKPWTRQKFRKHRSSEFQSFHGSQEKEWIAFDWAREIHEESAYMSISMGAPQIMGFNFGQIGYRSAKDMFDGFQTEEGQIEGFFDFLSTPMVLALRENRFVDFARLYNGSGQKERYGKWIREYFEVGLTLI